MLFMIIERFKGGDPQPVYRRFAERGRLAPPGLEYLGSWIREDLALCYQVMQCDDRALLDEWIAKWSDIVDFEIVPVITSEEAKRRSLEPGAREIL